MSLALFVTLLLGLMLVWLAFWLWQRSREARAASGLPRGKVVYADMDGARPPDGPLISRQWRLIGKPDYLIASGKHIIPVEVKSGSLPRSGEPYPGHVLQLAAYCLLVEDTYGRRPPFGYIRYQDATVQVPYTRELRSLLLDTLAAMEQAATARSVPRSHEDPWRCARCGLAHACDQRLS